MYVPVREAYKTRALKEEMTRFHQTISKEASKEPSEKNEDEEASARIYPDFYEEILQYNREIYESGQVNLIDAWSYEQPPFSVENYGMEDGIFGILRIPAMDAELPLYLGASRENLAKGAAVLGQTSIPIGQANSNSVIAAHRGWRGLAMFREIEELSLGDEVQIQNPWDTLVYQVREIQVIDPDDIASVCIQEGQDLVTLITCHPYGTSTYRYVVYCTPKETVMDESSGQEDLGQGQGTKIHVPGEEKARLQMKLERILPIAAIPLMIIAVALLIRPKGRR